MILGAEFVFYFQIGSMAREKYLECMVTFCVKWGENVQEEGKNGSKYEVDFKRRRRRG